MQPKFLSLSHFRVVFPHLPFLAVLALAAGCSSSTSPENVVCSDDPGTICTWAGTGAQGYNKTEKALLDSKLYWPIDVGFSTRLDAVRNRQCNTRGKHKRMTLFTVIRNIPTSK